MNIAVLAETAPAKTMIPVIEKIYDNNDILSLTHSDGAMELLSPYSTAVKSIGQSRRNTAVKRSNFNIGKLVLKDTYRAYRELKKNYIDLVLTCGNAGDVRKGILAAKKLGIPILHMEQDVYNPIEMIAYADLITVPNQAAEKSLKKMYGLTNTFNIRGYPQAEYVDRTEITPPHKIYEEYDAEDFYVLFLGGDTRREDIPSIIDEVQKLDKTILVVPYRFDPKYIGGMVTRDNVYVIDGFVDLISLMKASEGVIYCAGMGITIEVGALSIPSVKLLGFHEKHASNDLAKNLGINIVSAFDIEDAILKMKPPRGKRLVRNGYKASLKVAELINEMKMFDYDFGGWRSMKKIWNQRKKYR